MTGPPITSPSGQSNGGAAAGGGSADATIPSGGRTTGADGSTALSPDELQTAQAACVRYLTAQCTQDSQCDTSSSSASIYASCMTNQVACPAIFLSPGSRYTVDSLDSCADEWTAISCSDLNAGKLPSCVTTGTRSAGEPCRFGVQCTGGICSAQDPAACGLCLNPAASDQYAVRHFVPRVACLSQASKLGRSCVASPRSHRVPLSRPLWTRSSPTNS